MNSSAATTATAAARPFAAFFAFASAFVVGVLATAFSIVFTVLAFGVNAVSSEVITMIVVALSLVPLGGAITTAYLMWTGRGGGVR